MSLSLDAAHVEMLVTYVDRRVSSNGCDHTHRFTQEWASLEAIDWHELLDILELNGGHCDCEVVLNLPQGITLECPSELHTAKLKNAWLIPPAFECDPSAVFTKLIVCQSGLGRNTHANDGEVLVPAPKGASPRRRVRKSVNFFIGCQSGLPSEVGIVHDCSEISALDFSRKVAGSGFEELAGFTFREAGFVLSRIAPVQPTKPVATHFTDQIGIASRHEELRVHRVIIR
jgi:hypothetical protein